MYVPCRRVASARAALARTVEPVQRHLTFVLKLRNLLQTSWPYFFFDAFFSKNVQEGTFSPLNQDAKHIFEFEIRFFRLGFLTTEFIKESFLYTIEKLYGTFMIMRKISINFKHVPKSFWHGTARVPHAGTRADRHVRTLLKNQMKYRNSAIFDNPKGISKRKYG